MCAICGIFRPDGGLVDETRVAAMRDTMIPRGPDACGVKCGAGFGVGHRRLSIIDLSGAAGQPMTNEDGSVVIVFNGEIYNFKDLRLCLERQGHRFQSHGDTETLVHGYEEWGIDGLLRRVRGMYAFALIDLTRGEIHLVRDPLGKKPFFYRWQDDELLFASSARALVEALPESPEISTAAVDELLWTNCISASRTIFHGVKKVLPGSYWSLRRDGRSRETVYWQPPFFESAENTSLEERSEQIEEMLRTAVQRRFVSDVPVGVMLSGGVDSSLVTALAAQSMGRVKTFCVANEDPLADESHYAQAVADQYGTEHHVLRVRSTVREEMPRLVAAMGEPLADASAANLFSIAQLARQSVTVVLTGDGGDEAFGGYTAAWAAHLAERLHRRLPGCCGRPLAACATWMRRWPGAARRAGTLLHTAALPLEETLGNLWEPDERIRDTLYTPEFLRRLDGHHPYDARRQALAGNPRAPWADRMMKLHMQTVLRDDFLPKVDLATMGASLEARCPFLDLDLVELAVRTPARLRFAERAPKGILRRIARRHLPPHTVDRRKRGFSAPVDLWFRRDWRDLVDEFILGEQVERRGWFRRAALGRIVDAHYAGDDHGGLLWRLLILELWIRLVVDKTLTASDVI